MHSHLDTKGMLRVNTDIPQINYLFFRQFTYPLTWQQALMMHLRSQQLNISCFTV